ncbi:MULTISPECIES: DivIVA domain-containing protein [unclassified Microbacterium]|uniref:DivIVA domain-containing protein n=1 Tax=unclassified Microbacterium TaxID=2609290 RepID=UPI00214B194D|nr:MULTISPECIES: DivIVA domain-containing protein [unclassified Microbacterium]MCR2784102.1 DivIVA domain-containing protein [Microbacterium sp. zg.B96]WIM15060.1 DivIVA domain-containing protein [Microbacterium sp. zg-B96]
MHSSDIRGVQFPRLKTVLGLFGPAGYATGDVDEFLKQCAEALKARESGGWTRLRGEDIVVKQFDYTRRGGPYDSDAVDQFLDRVVALRAYEQPAG